MESTQRRNFQGVRFKELKSAEAPFDLNDDDDAARPSAEKRLSDSRRRLLYLCLLSWAVSLVLMAAYMRQAILLGRVSFNDEKLSYC